MLYKPELAEKIHSMLNENFGKMERLDLCCHHDPEFKEPTEVINVCPGCDKRYAKDYSNVTTLSLWEILAKDDLFALPDHTGKSMSILDACPTRENKKVQDAIRILLHKMNIELIEPKNTRSKGTCCGDSFYGVLTVEQVKNQMIKRASEMPLDNVAVYCVSCIKSVHIGGKKPNYLIDLLFDDETVPKTFEPDEWHKELDDYILKH